MSRRLGPCMCGATDCPSCGPAQGYTVVKVWRRGRYVYVNPEEDEEDEGGIDADDFQEPEPAEPCEHAADRASDRYQRDIERNYP